MYHKRDLQILQGIFDRSTNDIAILYGSLKDGLYELVRDFARDKESLYYLATPVTPEMQRMLFTGQLRRQTKTGTGDDYETAISSYLLAASGSKRIIILDNFQYIIRDNPTFINYLSSLIFEGDRRYDLMFLLVSDDIKWVEKDMVRLIGKKSSEISAVIKLNGFTPAELQREFPQMPQEELVKIYSVLGGNCLYYNDLTDKTKAPEVIKRLLAKCNDTFFLPSHFLPGDIREPAIYNTILACIAAKEAKLNDIHNMLKMDRAKLSTYMRILEENGIIEKLKGAQVGDTGNIKKATYRIKDLTVRFYYRFIFDALSQLRILGEDRFYKRYIEGGFPDYIEDIYPLYCMEHVKWLNSENRLNFAVETIEEYFGKSGAIDFVIVAKGGGIISCACNYKEQDMKYSRLLQIRDDIRHNKLSCDNIWLFSAGGFDKGIRDAAEEDAGIKLIGFSEQSLR